MSTETHVIELIPAFALDCLDEDDRQTVTAHLAECPSCRAELDAYRAVADELALAAPDALPSPLLHNRLRESIRRPAEAPPIPAPAMAHWWQSLVEALRRPVPAWNVMAVALAIVVVVGALLWWRPPRQPAGTMQTVALLATDAAPHAQGMLIIGTDGVEGALVVEDMPPLDDAHQYQLWLIKDGRRTNGAVFSVDEGGYETLLIKSDVPLASFSAFGITIEPAGGSPGPTGPKILGGEMVR